MSKPKVLVTGAGGFIGTHLIRYLKQNGYWVRGVDLKKPQWSESEADQFAIRDLRRWADAMDAMHSIDWVFALAADMGGMGFITSHDAQIISNNTMINMNSIEAARLNGVSRYLFSSSACIYPLGLQKDDALPLAEGDAYPADPQHCLTPDTEVMTRDGFKFISDINLDDEVATLSDEGYLEFHKPTQLQVMEYSGQMIHFKGRYFDCIVTPNHSAYASLDRKSNPVRIAARDLISRKPIVKGYFWRNCKWHGRDYPETVKIPSVPFERNPDKAYRGERKKKGFTVDLDDYLCFMGWYITEGCCILHSSKGYEVHIRQCDQVNLASIKSLLDRMKITYYDPGDGRVVIDSKPLWTHLQDCGQGAAKKKLPLWILDLPPDRLKILFRAMMLGDGSYETRRGNGDDIPKTYFTSSPFLRDQFVEICLKLGYACAIRTQPAHGNIKTRYMIHISIQKFKHKVRDKNIEMVDYSGPVYDMTVPNHVFYIRYNGKHVWTGNSYGWEKLHAEHLCRYYREAGWLLDACVVRFHNCYGPEGSWNDGREKAPAALCRKVAMAELAGCPEVEIWGDGGQVRSYMYVGDCVDGLLRVMEAGYPGPLNIGRDREITVDALADVIAGIAGIEIIKNHVPGPEGVRRRNSDNTLCRQVLNWEPTTPVEQGLVPTYEWIKEQVLTGEVM